jgi:hypothetical protein
VATRRPDPTAFLLIAGGSADSETIAADVIGGDADGVRTWTVPDAGHVQGLRTAPEEWERRVVDFLHETWGASSPRSDLLPIPSRSHLGCLQHRGG